MERHITVAKARLRELETAVRSMARTARRLNLNPEPLMVVHVESQREVEVEHQTLEMSDDDPLPGIMSPSSPVTVKSTQRYAVTVVDCVVTLPENGVRAPGKWRFVGAIEQIAAAADRPGSKMNDFWCRAEDSQKMERFRDAGLECEHCKAKRNRVRTVAIEETGSGRLMQVGKECAEAFLGARWEEELGEIEFRQFVATLLKPFEDEMANGFGGGGRGEKAIAWDADEVVCHACACIRTHGWEKTYLDMDEGSARPERNPRATSETVKSVLSGQAPIGEARQAAVDGLTKARKEAEENLASVRGLPGAGEIHVRCFEDLLEKARRREAAGLPEAPYEMTDADRTKAAEVLSWLARQTPDPEKDRYLATLKALFDPGWVSSKRLGLGVSVVRAYDRSIEMAEDEKARAMSNFVGTLGERREFVAALISSFRYGGQFPGIIYKFRDPQGNTLIWRTSSYGLDRGDFFRLKGTIKEHGDYKGEKQTELSRVKVLEILERLPGFDPRIPAEQIEALEKDLCGSGGQSQEIRAAAPAI